MALEKDLLGQLSKGWFFNPRTQGIKRVRTLTKKWIDEHTEEKRLRHLFARKAQTVGFPSPKYFAINLGTLGWWTTNRLYRLEINGYKEKLDAVRAKFLASLRDPFFLARFKEIANAFGYTPAQLLQAIKFSLPARKVTFIEVNNAQKEEIMESFKKSIDMRILLILRLSRELLTKGVKGRKDRIRKIDKLVHILEELNVVNYHKQLMDDAFKAYSSIATLSRGEFPATMDVHLTDMTVPKPVKTEITKLLKDAQVNEYWRL